MSDRAYNTDIVEMECTWYAWYNLAVCYVRYQAPGSAGTFYHADASSADQKPTETRSRRQRKHYLSAEIQSKYPDFPLMDKKRDRLKQQDKPQQHKKAAAEVVEKPKLSGNSTVVTDTGRTAGTEAKMDVWQSL